jgi:hypothetical protein
MELQLQFLLDFLAEGLLVVYFLFLQHHYKHSHLLLIHHFEDLLHNRLLFLHQLM